MKPDWRNNDSQAGQKAKIDPLIDPNGFYVLIETYI